MTAVDGAATSIVGAAGELDPTAPDDLVTSVYRAMGADDCLTEQPPDGCRMVDHRGRSRGDADAGGVALPRLGPFTDSTGQVDAAAYAAALLDRVAALGQVLTGEGRDRRAAALGLLDGFVPAFGAGPYRVISVAPGERMVLEPVPGQSDPPSIGRVVLQAVADTSIAVTMLQAGDVDWVPRIDHALADAINGSGRPATAGLRPLESSWLVVFNTRKGHPYADALTRAAFVACIDAPGLTASVGGGEAIVADTPLAAGSWAMGPAKGRGRDVAWAERRLDSAGWTMGSDGIRVRDGQRLSTSVALRGSQVALLAMMQAAAGQLRECGIELAIEDLDVTGDRLLQQIRWPNDFVSADHAACPGRRPDADLEAFEASRDLRGPSVRLQPRRLQVLGRRPAGRRGARDARPGRADHAVRRGPGPPDHRGTRVVGVVRDGLVGHRRPRAGRGRGGHRPIPGPLRARRPLVDAAAHRDADHVTGCVGSGTGAVRIRGRGGVGEPRRTQRGSLRRALTGENGPLL
ncbi:MAG: ABC transporter substrate-binding protein [Chloroflexota bacterium]